MPVAPTERYETFAHLALQIVLTQLSSWVSKYAHDIERIFSLCSRGFVRDGRNVSPMAINSWCRRNDWVSRGFLDMEKVLDIRSRHATRHAVETCWSSGLNQARNHRIKREATSCAFQSRPGAYNPVSESESFVARPAPSESIITTVHPMSFLVTVTVQAPQHRLSSPLLSPRLPNWLYWYQELFIHRVTWSGGWLSLRDASPHHKASRLTALEHPRIRTGSVRVRVRSACLTIFDSRGVNRLQRLIREEHLYM